MNKRLKLILKIVGSIFLGLFVLGIVVPLVDRAVPLAPKQRDFVFVRDAEFDATDFNKLAEKNKVFDPENNMPVFAVQLHWIKPGTGTILAIRSYSPGRLFVMDDEVYEKLTIWISDLKVGVYEIGKDSSQVKVYYNRGGSAWPEGGGRRYLDEGLVMVTALYHRRVEFKVSARFDCLDIRGGSPRSIEVSDNFVLKEIGFEELSPWIGQRPESVGAHVYSETYRR